MKTKVLVSKDRKKELMINENGQVFRRKVGEEKWNELIEGNGLWLQGTKGYEHLAVRWNNKNVFVHQLIARYFVHRYPGQTIVHHLDMDKLNNNAENLVWCTREEHFMYHDLQTRIIDGLAEARACNPNWHKDWIGSKGVDAMNRNWYENHKGCCKPVDGYKSKAEYRAATGKNYGVVYIAYISDSELNEYFKEDEYGRITVANKYVVDTVNSMVTNLDGSKIYKGPKYSFNIKDGLTINSSIRALENRFNRVNKKYKLQIDDKKYFSIKEALRDNPEINKGYLNGIISVIKKTGNNEGWYKEKSIKLFY